MTEQSKKMSDALGRHLTPCMRALGFSGGHSGYRRLTPHGVHILVVPTFGGVVQLDAGRLKARRVLTARTVRQDWGIYANPNASPSQQAARRRLETAAGKGVWRYDNLRTTAEFDKVAVAMTRVVKTAGVAFWTEGPPKKAKAAKAKRVTAEDRTRTMKALLAKVLVPRLRELGFAGTVSGGSGAFRRVGRVTELVSVSVGGGNVCLQVAAGKPGRRTGAGTAEHEFVMAAERVDLVDKSFAVSSPRALESLVASLVVAVERSGAKYWARCKL